MKNALKVVLKVLGVLSFILICGFSILKNGFLIDSHQGRSMILTEELCEIYVDWEVEYSKPFRVSYTEDSTIKTHINTFMDLEIKSKFNLAYSAEALYNDGIFIELYVNSLESDDYHIRKSTHLKSTFVVDVVWGFNELNEEEINQFIKNHYNTLEKDLNADLIAIFASNPYVSREEHIKILGKKYDGILTINDVTWSEDWYYECENLDPCEEITFTWHVDSLDLDNAFKSQMEIGIYKSPKNK